MSCTVSESGTQVSFIYIPEAVCNTTPTLTSVSNVAADRTGSVSKFTRASGSWVTDGFVVEMHVRVAGFTAAANNADWKVVSVTATDLVVRDLSGVITTETAGAGKSCTIVFGTLRLTSPRQLNSNRETIESDEVRSSREVVDVRHGFTEINGSLGFELSLDSHTTMLGVTLGGTWTKPTLTGSPNLAMAAATPGAGKARITRAAGSFITDGFRLGDVWTASGFTNPANNIQWQITAVTATTIDLADPNSVAVAQASSAGPTLTFPGYRMDGKTEIRTMTVERRFNGTGYYDKWAGLSVNELAFQCPPKEKVTATATILGMSSTALSGTSIATTGIAAAPQTGFMTLSSAYIYENGSRAAYVTNLNFSIANNRSTEAVIGSKFSPGLFDAPRKPTGTLSAFFTDSALPNAFYNETLSSLFLRLADGSDATQFISITFPKIKYTSSEIDPPQTGPVVNNMNFTALGTSLADPSGATVESSVTIQVSYL